MVILFFNGSLSQIYPVSCIGIVSSLLTQLLKTFIRMLPKQLNLKPYHDLQRKMSNQVIKTDEFGTIRYIAGTDVAYHKHEDRMVGAFVVLDAKTLEVVDQAHHEMETTFPYIPGLFSFREIPPLLEAYQKLQIKPDLIVCDAQGIAHPKGVGMATHLGIELNVPTIGCAKKRLVGQFDANALAVARGSQQPLRMRDKTIGVALRTQDSIKPLFISIGHRIALATAIKWVLHLTPKYRLPETTRQADQLVNRVLKHSE